MFKDRNYEKAEKIYRQINEKDPTNIDAITSTALCVKQRLSMEPNKVSVFQEVAAIYRQALALDSQDVEANFNMGIMFLAGEY